MCIALKWDKATFIFFSLFSLSASLTGDAGPGRSNLFIHFSFLTAIETLTSVMGNEPYFLSTSPFRMKVQSELLRGVTSRWKPGCSFPKSKTVPMHVTLEIA